jgi:hypothetical protein
MASGHCHLVGGTCRQDSLRAGCRGSIPTEAIGAVSAGRLAIERAAKIFFQLHFFDEEVCSEAAHTRIVVLQVSDMACIEIAVDRRWHAIQRGQRVGAHCPSASLAPAVIRHQAHAQGLGTALAAISVVSAPCCHDYIQALLCGGGVLRGPSTNCTA